MILAEDLDLIAAVAAGAGERGCVKPAGFAGRERVALGVSAGIGDKQMWLVESSQELARQLDGAPRGQGAANRREVEVLWPARCDRPGSRTSWRD